MFGGLIQALDVACLITVMWVVTLRRGVVTWRPTVWLGRISYGVYLWHWPLMMLLHPVTNDWLRAGLTLGASSLMAAASNRWVETPIRYSGRGAHVRRQPLALRLGLVLGAFAVVIAVALSNGHRGTTRPFDLSFSPAEIKEIAVPSPSPSPSPTLTRPPTPEGRPICRSIIHIGDSNLGVARPLFKAAYAGTGVEAFIDHANGRSAYRAHSSLDDGTISAIRRLGATAISPRCWIIAATLEDAAESRQAGESPTTRIHDVVEALHGEPSIWLTPALRGPEPYSQTAAQAYSAALMQQLSDDPNVSILDWRSLATPRAAEFQPDGIHYTHPLYTSLVRAVMAEVTDNWTLIVDRS
jgi:hypothetical protein